jgi:hypothetical protein
LVTGAEARAAAVHVHTAPCVLGRRRVRVKVDGQSERLVGREEAVAACDPRDFYGWGGWVNYDHFVGVHGGILTVQGLDIDSILSADRHDIQRNSAVLQSGGSRRAAERIELAGVRD